MGTNSRRSTPTQGKSSRSRTSHRKSTSLKKIQASDDIQSVTEQLSGGIPRMDELTEEQLAVFAQNCWLVSLVRNGVPVKEALLRLGINRSERSVRDLMRRFRKSGQRGLLDQRWFRRTEAEVLIPEVKRLALAIYLEYPAAGPRAVWSELCKVCRERSWNEPSESTVGKFLAALPEALKMFRQGKSGIRKWEQTAAPVVRYENTTFANQRWQGDHSPLQIWVRARVGGVWQAFRAYISVVLDADSRSIPGFVVSIKYPDAWTIALLFYRAIRKKRRKTWLNRGIPFIFQSDRGKDFLSHAVASTLSYLGTQLDPDPPYYPNGKGKVERWFLTLDTGCLRLLPGHMSAVGTSEGAAAKRVHEFLTVPQLTTEIERWIDEEYHRRTHSETGRKPAELWEETVHMRMPEKEDDLNLLFLKEDVERSVKNTGIRITMDGVKRIYWSPTLMYHFGERVRIAYNPEDTDSILVYCAARGKYICEAFDMRAEQPRYTARDVLQERGLFRRGMKERIKDYMDEVYREDRRMARIDEWEEARRDALAAQESQMTPTYDSNTSAEDDEDMMDILEKFRRRDRGDDYP